MPGARRHGIRRRARRGRRASGRLGGRRCRRSLRTRARRRALGGRRGVRALRGGPSTRDVVGRGDQRARHGRRVPRGPRGVPPHRKRPPRRHRVAAGGGVGALHELLRPLEVGGPRPRAHPAGRDAAPDRRRGVARLPGRHRHPHLPPGGHRPRAARHTSPSGRHGRGRRGAGAPGAPPPSSPDTRRTGEPRRGRRLPPVPRHVRRARQADAAHLRARAVARHPADAGQRGGTPASRAEWRLPAPPRPTEPPTPPRRSTP